MTTAMPVPIAASRLLHGVLAPRSIGARSTVSRAVVTIAATLLAACSPPTVPTPDPDHDCTSGQERDCYDGPEGTFGVGSCRAGTQTCVDGEWGECTGSVTPSEETCNGEDDDCDGAIDEGVTNACGGCGELEEIPGDTCESCGTWTCADVDAVICAGDREPDSDTCLADNGCTGALGCEENGLVTCHAVETRNQCNVCGGPDLPELGETCTTDDGCEGTFVCDGNGNGVVCDGPSKNECGVCGAAAVADVGDSCVAENGCDGALACNAEGTGTTCITLAEKNQCGVCGGPDLADFGTGCDVQGCLATWVCNDTGDALLCDSAGRNNCAACDVPDVANLDSTCQDADGCEGVLICDGEGTGSTCKPHFPMNECDVCGPPVEGVGAFCEDEFLCPGEATCNGSGTGTTCSVVRPAGVGNNCFDADGCPGTFFCDGDGGVVCVAEDACELPQHVVISELSVGRLGGANPTNQFIELYNPTSEPYDLTQLEIWVSDTPDTGTHGPPALSKRLCVACTVDDSITDCGNKPGSTNGWAPGCAGTAVIQPRSYFLLGHNTGYAGSATYPVPGLDGRHSVLLQFRDGTNAPTGGQVWLFEGEPSANADVVDMVGYGTASLYEGTGAAPLHDITQPPTGPQPPIQSIERKAFRNSTAESMAADGPDAGLGNGSDTGDNASDFVVRPARNPQNSQSPAEPVLPVPAG